MEMKQDVDQKDHHKLHLIIQVSKVKQIFMIKLMIQIVNNQGRLLVDVLTYLFVYKFLTVIIKLFKMSYNSKTIDLILKA